VIPILKPTGVKLFLVSIGTSKSGSEFCKLTGFPTDQLLCDPGNVLYKAIGFYKGLGPTFFNTATPKSIMVRWRKDRAADLKEAMSNWKVFVPPKNDYALQQGGTLIFKGRDCILADYEEGTGTHIDFDTLIEVARGAV